MTEEKIEVIKANYDSDKKIAKIKVLKEDGKEVTWALLGDDFDSLIFQITNKSLRYNDEQRSLLCKKMIGTKFMNRIEVDIKNRDINSIKDKDITDLQLGHDAIDRYPFYEIQQEIIERSTDSTTE